MRFGFTRFLFTFCRHPWDAVRLAWDARLGPAPAPHHLCRIPIRWNHSDRTLYYRPRSADSGTIHEIFYRRIYDLPAGFRPETIMDVGASAGYATLDFATRFPNARSVSFEPLSNNYEILQRHVLGNRLAATCHPYGLGSSTRRMAMHLSGGSGMTGSATILGGEELALGSGGVQVRDVLEVWDELAWSTVDLFKLDCEGAESEILPRLAGRLASIRLMVGEMHPALCDPKPLIALLEKTHDVQTEGAEGADYFHFSARLRGNALAFVGLTSDPSPAAPSRIPNP